MQEFILSYWLEALFGLALTGLGLAYKRLKRRFKEQDDIKAGVVAMLHDRLYQSCMYFIELGEIPLSALKNIEHMYKAYHKLGGNGTGTELYERVNELPLKK